MEPFTKLTAIAAPIDEPNVDTNQLCPTRFNKVPRGPKHAQILFHDRRFNADGSEKDHVLNREPFRRAQIIVADRNWGCGSSREHAPIAIKVAGLSCVIARSFARIFYRNSFNMGLPIFESADLWDMVADGQEIEVDGDRGSIIIIGDERKTLTVNPIPPFMQELINDGGLMKHIERKRS